MNRSRAPLPSKRDSHRERSSAPDHASAGAGSVLLVNDWTILLHPLFVDQLTKLVSAADAERSKRTGDVPTGTNMKVADAIRQLILREIPEDPSRTKYRQGSTLGGEHKHWSRAKFGNGRFRLFFRYQSRARIIVFTWVNDSETLRTYGSRTDAYAVFRRMLESGNPPDALDALIREASAPDVIHRARALLDPPPTSDRPR